ncbi:MAG: SRPBCC family protein [Acidobacteriota bacterium]|nr:SRPBCC family protein [Acidobacteriota bacterium]
MSERVIEREHLICGRSLDEVFAFFAQARNLELLTPSWLSFEVLTPEPIEMRRGTIIDYRLRLHGLPLRWRSRIEAWEPGRRFVDLQLRGPYRLWHHTHEFEACEGGTLIRDRVRYALPLGALGDLVGRLLVRRDLERVFDFRRTAIAGLLGPGGGAGSPGRAPGAPSGP